jgi:hypothetical protein
VNVPWCDTTARSGYLDLLIIYSSIPAITDILRKDMPESVASLHYQALNSHIWDLAQFRDGYGCGPLVSAGR